MAPRGTLKGGASSPGDVRSIVHVSMSAYGYKRTFWGMSFNVRFTPESGHSEPTPEMSAFDPKRTFIGLCELVGRGRKSEVSVQATLPAPTSQWIILL